MSRDPLAEILEQTWRDSRGAGLSITATCDMLAQVFHEHHNKIGEQREVEGLSKADHVNIQSIVAYRTGLPAVQCCVGYEQWQWDAETAREHALALLRCAEAAVHDAAMMRWLTLGPIGMDAAPAARAMSELRRFRGDVEPADWRVPDE